MDLILKNEDDNDNDYKNYCNKYDYNKKIILKIIVINIVI